MDYKVSVIIPVYNVENYLRECLDSIVNQTLDDLEILCINDGSTDSSGEILEEYRLKDSRVIVINKQNEGYGAACNTGLRMARGEYISIIESDDFIDSKMFEDMYNLAIRKNVDIVKSAFYEYEDRENGSNINKINWDEDYEMPQEVFNIEEHSQFIYFHPSIWSCIYKKEFLDKHNITFVEAKGAGWVDNPFQVQTLCLAKRIFYTNEAYYYYRLTNPTSSSNIVAISNPFDRTDEVHSFLNFIKEKDNDLWAHLYKREFSYIDTVLRGLTQELFPHACKLIKKMISDMDEYIINSNNLINDYEKDFCEQCKSDRGISNVMKVLQENTGGISVVNA